MIARGRFRVYRGPADDTDLVEELQLRCWARRHYCPESARDMSWHPVVLEEMACKDRELASDVI